MLAASSIACLLADFYRLCPMRTFTLFIFLPATLMLFAWAVADRLWGSRQFWRGIMIGVAAGLIPAFAHDFFQLAFFFARDLGIASVVAPPNLVMVLPPF